MGASARTRMASDAHELDAGITGAYADGDGSLEGILEGMSSGEITEQLSIIKMLNTEKDSETDKTAAESRDIGELLDDIEADLRRHNTTL